MKFVHLLVILAIIGMGVAPSSRLSAQGLAKAQNVGPTLAKRRRVPLLDLDFSNFTASTTDTAAAMMAPSPGDIDPQNPTVVIDSVSGLESNAGTLDAPKQFLHQPAPNGSVFGLCRGSLFRESLPFSNLGTTHDILVEDISSGTSDALPIISALDPLINNGVVNNGDGTYWADWLSEKGVANDGYQNVYVIEINTATEAVTPVASRRRMIDATDDDAVVATPGSVYVQPFGSNHWLCRLHPSDGLAPGSGIYRYEVVSRFCPANWGIPANTGDGAMAGLALVGSSWGYGSLGGPPNFSGDRLAFLHCTTHCAVIGGGSLQRSVFYEAGDPTTIQLAWYTGNGTGLSWNTDRCLFYANVGDRPATFLIAHTAGANFDRGDISDCAFIGARWSDGSLNGTAIDYVNVAAGTVNHVYVWAVAESFGPTMPTAVEIKNSIFREVNKTAIGGNFHDNVVLAEGGTSGTDTNHRLPIGFMFRNDGAALKNNLFVVRGLTTSQPADSPCSAYSVYPGVSTGSATRNIILLSPATPTTGCYYNQNPQPAGITLDYNLVITTGQFSALGQPFTTGKTSWDAYVAANPSLDQHSLYIDLSADPRGLQAVFMDAINGDFRWAQTDVGQRCADYCQANQVGPAAVPSAWPVVPTVDQAVQTLSGL